MLARSLKRLSALAALVVGAALPATAAAQVPLINGFGGTVGYGTQCLSPNDDGSSRVIDLRPAFPSGLVFFGRTHTTAYVNTNGNITFSGPVGTYTPRPFPVANQPMIAPYWADVDIRGSSCSGFGGDRGCMNPTSNGVWWHLEPGRMIVTWHQVGYFSCHDDKKMNFQLILTAAPDCGPAGIGNFDVEFRYNRCEWTTGDASGGSGGFGGTPAQAGFDAGNSRDFVEIMGSRTGTIHTTLCTMSNVGMPGIWRFGVRGGNIMCPGAGAACETGMQGVCNEGRQQCVGSGLSCVPVNTPGPRRCNGLDNDCDGMVDSGDELCGADEICDGSACVARCVEGSCFPGETCTARGTCVETACVSVTCPPGQRCRGGSCVGGCEGVTCPHGQQCRSGRCVDPCAGLTCGENTVCINGICEVSCPCRACGMGQTCMGGRCVANACAMTTCSAGQFCREGRCVDACEGAVCPMGQRCEAGNCVAAATEPDAGAPDSSVPPRDGSVTFPDVVDPDRDAGPTGDGAADSGRRGVFAPRDPGCGCRTPGAVGGVGGWAAALALGALGAVGRRRRRR